LRSIPEAIFDSCSSLGTLFMGYSAYLLDN
jgi:hypothetical protein